MRKFLCILFVSMIAFFSVALAADLPTGISVTEITVEEPISHIAIVGEMVSVDLPEIPGYVPVVLYPAVEMPGRDVEYAVIYLPEELYSSLALFFTVEDYDAPLGLGYTVMNVGVCIE